MMLRAGVPEAASVAARSSSRLVFSVTAATTVGSGVDRPQPPVPPKAYLPPQEATGTGCLVTSKVSEPCFRLRQKPMFGFLRFLAKFSAVMRKGKDWTWKAG